MRGKDAKVEWDNDKATVVALREIAEGYTDFDTPSQEDQETAAMLQSLNANSLAKEQSKAAAEAAAAEVEAEDDDADDEADADISVDSKTLTAPEAGEENAVKPDTTDHE